MSRGVGTAMKRLGCDLREKRLGKLVVARTETECCVTPVIWFAFCDCGNTTSVSEDDLVNGKTTSCGCEKEKDNDSV